MIDITIDKVFRGWSVAQTGVRDQVEYVLEENDGPRIQSYDSVRMFMKLYLCSCGELTTSDVSYPTVFEIDDSDGGVEFTIRDETIETSFPELCSEATAALREIFDALDRESSAESRKAALETMTDRWSWLDDAEQMYEDVQETAS